MPNPPRPQPKPGADKGSKKLPPWMKEKDGKSTKK
jgi:hypothetical protein